MRQLRKLIFINSANIPYGEVALDGNVHFIGTQGVGKSTLLRAILFFYNADMRKLGIPTEKSSFLEYYFSNLNAHLVYEVQSDKNVYCVWAFKSQNRICYRLIDHSYQKDFFIENYHSKTEKEVQKTLNELGISYTTKRIDRYEDYRNIIYGNSKREYKKYAILESNAYQNIPRTISNVFLNSKLEATFIKNTIINSITEDKNKVSIELNNTRKNVASFQKSYDEIHVFKKHKKQGDNIINSYRELLNHEKTLKKTAKQLGVALRNGKNRVDELSKILQTKRQEEDNYVHDLDFLNKEYNTDSQVFKDEIAVLNDKIKNAISKVSFYQKKNIENVLKLHGQKSALKIELETAIKEQRILTDKHQSIEERYERLLEQIKQKEEKFKNLYDKNVNELYRQFISRKAEIDKIEQETIDVLNENARKRIEVIRQELVEAKEVVTKTNFELKDIQRTTFRQVELTSIAKTIRDLEGTIRDLESDLKNEKKEKEVYQKEGNKSIERLEQESVRQQADIQQKIEQANKDLAKTLQHIDAYETTLYGFLDSETNFDWRKNIGKVFQEEVLLNMDLNPSFKTGKNSFFGLKLNLDKLSVSAKTFDDFVYQKNRLEQELQNWKENLGQLVDVLTEERNKLKQKHNIRLKKFQKEINRLSAQRDLDSQKLKQRELDEINLTDLAKKEKEAALDAKKEEMRCAKEVVLDIEAKKRKLQQEVDEKKEEIKQKYKVKNVDLKSEFAGKKATLKQTYDTQQIGLKKEHNKLHDERQAELKNEGANVNRLNLVEKQIKSINQQLDTIEQNTSLVNEYHKDKRELIDKKSDFEQSLTEEKIALSNIRNQFQKQQEAVNNDIRAIRQTIDILQNEYNNLGNELKAYEEGFKISGLYQTLKNEIEEDTKIKSVKESINKLTANLRGIDEAMNRTKSSLEQKVTKFAGYFQVDNDLDLNLRFEQKTDFIRFAQRLEEIVDNDLITAKETETQKYFNQLLNNIAAETSALNGLRSEIETVITKINQDFRSGNFVDAVQKIELRTKESDNKVVRRLLAVQKFKEANQNIGYDGLFSVLQQPANAKKAINLLQNLAEEINQTKANTIHLEHSFELEFRVQENNNDTSWVEKISNVGSNGTDVLVKAMVYIMLLNVFKNKASRKVKDFTIHCIIDEVGILHNSNLKGLLRFANERNIFLINGSPNPNDVSVYKHTYELIKNRERQTQIRHLLKMNI